MNLNELADVCYAIAKEKGWHDRYVSQAERIALMHSELSEALEEIRNGHVVHEVYEVDGKPEGVPIELADVLIRVFDFCGLYGIDLQKAVDAKIAYNRTRPYRHGGKLL